MSAAVAPHHAPTLGRSQLRYTCELWNIVNIGDLRGEVKSPHNGVKVS